LPNGHVRWPREAMSAPPKAEASLLHLSHNQGACIIRAKLPTLQQAIGDLTAFQKSTFSGVMPHTGFIGVTMSKLIDELKDLDIIEAPEVLT
jgi:hypothetical protein